MTEAGQEHQVWRDPIVAEVRRVREQLFAAAGDVCSLGRLAGLAEYGRGATPGGGAS